MSLTLKLFSLVTRTLAKPLGNKIKQQAREHQWFRKKCVNFAQNLHRFDMRMRLGLLSDPAVIDRQIEREAQEAEERRLRAQHRPAPGTPTVRTEAEMKADAEAREKDRRLIEGKLKEGEKRKEKRLIKPLSEAKAIDTGANFLSEAFVFFVAVSLLLVENVRSRRKEASRRDVVKERLDNLEDEVLKTQQEKHLLEEELADLRSRVLTLPFPFRSPPAPPKQKPVEVRILHADGSEKVNDPAIIDNTNNKTSAEQSPELTTKPGRNAGPQQEPPKPA